MKPGIRKRQAAFEEYLGSLWSDGNRKGAAYDEDKLLSLVRDGLYLNKTTCLPSYSPGWLLILQTLENELDFDEDRLSAWVGTLEENGANLAKRTAVELTGIELAARDSDFRTLKVLIEHLDVDLGTAEHCLISLAMPAQLHESSGKNKTIGQGEMLDLVRFLHARGHRLDDGLIQAVADGHVPIIKFMVENGAKVNYQNSAGVSALMYAFGQPASRASWAPSGIHSVEIATFLLERGADPGLRTNQRRTCRSILKAQDHWTDDFKAELDSLLDAYGG